MCCLTARIAVYCTERAQDWYGYTIEVSGGVLAQELDK